jgi:hypothetical protein
MCVHLIDLALLLSRRSNCVHTSESESHHSSTGMGKFDQRVEEETHSLMIVQLCILGPMCIYRACIELCIEMFMFGNDLLSLRDIELNLKFSEVSSFIVFRFSGYPIHHTVH